MTIHDSTPPPRRRSTRSPWLLAGALLASGGIAAGCLVGTCTEAACTAGLDLTVDGGEERLAPGVYRVRADVDGGTFEVECTLDDEGQGDCEAGAWVAEPSTDFDAHASAWPSDEYEERGDAIHLSFIGTSSARFGADQFGPEAVELTVERDGVEVARESIDPEYEVFEDFNGKGCGDCSHARAVVSIAP